MNNFLKKHIWLIGVIVLFLISRLFILQGYGVYWTDVGLYFEKAFAGIKADYTAYRDFWWPYPPLTLPVIYFPILFFPGIEVLNKPSVYAYLHNYIIPYRTVFQLEMFFFDFTTLVYLILFLKKRLKTDNKNILFAILFYSVLGLLVGHLIYDRLDIVISAVFMASVYHFTSEKRQFRNRVFSYLVYLGGSLFKLLPLLWWPVYFISECFSENCEVDERKGLLDRWFVSKRNLERALMPFFIIVIPFVIIMFSYNKMTFNEEKQQGMFTYMGEHGQRGIQMESAWATPMMICNAYSKSRETLVPFPLVTNFGAQHFDDSRINSFYLMLSKYFGFFSLALIYIALFLYFLLKKEKRKIVTDPVWILSFLLFALLYIISTQRVLSSQYIIWPMAGISVLIFSSKRTDIFLLIMTALIFMLSYIGFDLGYEKYINFNPWIVASVSLRNLLLIVLTIQLFFRIIPKTIKE